MNLKTTIETLRRIERLLDSWQSSGDIPAIERDLACDLLRRAYDDIFFTDNYVATVPEASLAENTSADRMNGNTAGEVADTPVAAATEADGALVADGVSPIGLAGLASSVQPAEGTAGESPENTEAVAESAAQNASIEIGEVPAAGPVGEDAPVGIPAEESVPVEESVGEPVEESVSVGESVGEPVEESVSVEEPASVGGHVEENIPAGTTVEEPVEEDRPVDAPVGEVAEEETTGEEFEVSGVAGTVEGSGDATLSAEDVATSIPDASADVVIDPVFEVFTDDDEDAEESEDAEAVDLAGAVNIAEAVEAVGAAGDTEIAEETEAVKETAAEEPQIEHPVAAPSAVRSVATAVEPAVECGLESVPTPASAGSSAGEAPADVAASSAETLEEMAARFKNASGRRRKSRRAFMSLYDDDEMARSGGRTDQLELSDWGIEPSGPSSKLRHTRELFGLPVDDPDTASEPTPQPATESATESAAAAVDTADATDDEIEVLDFVGDDDPVQGDRGANPAAEPLIKPATKPASEPAAQPAQPTQPTQPTQPAPRPTVAPAREGRDEAEDDLPFDEAVVALEDSDDTPSAMPPLEPLEPLGTSGHSEVLDHSEAPDAVPFDSIEIVEITDGDDETSETEEGKVQHTDRAEVTDRPARSGATAPAALATEPAALRGLYGREEKSELPASTTVLGEVMGHDALTVADSLGHDAPTVADSLGHRPDVAGWADVSDDLNQAISVGDRFVLLRDLFDGDQALCDRTLKRLSTFDDLDDCMIWITENFAWNANSEGAKLIMGLLERKLG